MIALLLGQPRTLPFQVKMLELLPSRFHLFLQLIQAAYLIELAQIRQLDSRQLPAFFNRVCNVGMFERVGCNNLLRYFRRIHGPAGERPRRHRAPASHSSDLHDPERLIEGGQFVDRCVFPQGELRHVSLALRAPQDRCLYPLDLQSLPCPYGRLLERCGDRVDGQSETILRMVRRESYRICRVYLAGCPHAFHADDVSMFGMLYQRSDRM
ncbi:class I SAM-dependent methyltransferase [Ralstonia solanacearum]|uniref:class I SAM-dependent methyltransferase n=1 Tax=Ralstonia solanacearum TaxID=305 RepID=UPI000A1204FC|nr:class I SAM-dependent methyltransferase [Ralstonia solanacearum]